MGANLSGVQCAYCGFHDDSVSPADAAVALRSYPRRYRAVLVRMDDEDGARVVTAPAADGWSALDHAAHVAVALEAGADALRLVSIEDDPLIAYAPERREPSPGGVSVDDVLDRLTGACGRAADEVERVKGDDWRRPGRVGDGESVTALDVARYLVHEGVHHLRGAERAVQAAVSAT
jgi:hypothetical protein